MMAQTMAEMKNSFGFGKNDWNKGSPSVRVALAKFYGIWLSKEKLKIIKLHHDRAKMAADFQRP
tara:strand:- start:513 stop:704 length:192 start_codon:yes stop_codon:yes gene_type:complete